MNGFAQMQTAEKYNCEKCKFFTKDPNKYNIHIALHNEIKYVCSFCNLEMFSKTEFQRHLISHTGKFPYTCGYCGYGAIRNDIVKHIKKIHGDGKILCSVSTIENESRNASVNIIQTQVRTSLQEILPNNATVVSKSLVDLTNEVDSSIINSNLSHLNVSNSSITNGDQVEVEVISPVDQQLNPWTPLTVVAPTSFKVPENCLAEVLEVKPVNGTCHLVLKCLEVINSIVPNNNFSKENLYEKNTSELLESTKNSFGSSNGSSLQECTPLINGSEYPQHAFENPSNDLASPLNEMKVLKDTPNELLETEELSDGPIISSVFSLSSDSQNIIEGIQWESPIAVTNVSKDIVETASSLTFNNIQSGPKVHESAANCQVEIEKKDELKIALQSGLPETEVGKVKDMDEIKLNFRKPPSLYDKPEIQTYAFAQINKQVECKLNRLSRLESFSKPHTLFVSSNKRIVMQPLSCLMQTAHKTERSIKAKHVHFKKMKWPTGKPKRKILHKFLTAPSLKTLRLYPVKPDQLTQLPHKNQPVVVLNHPDLESLETFSIMKTIGMFKGKVVKVTLSKQMHKKFV